MPGKARPGKQKTHKGAKKRTKVTGSGKIVMQKAAHNHRLAPKASRQKKAASKPLTMLKGAVKNLSRLLSN